LRTHGITPDRNLFISQPDDEIWNYQQIDLGFNYRMTELQAALGLSQVNRLSDFVEKRHHLAEQYNFGLNGVTVTLPHQADGTYSSYHLYPILLSPDYGCPSQRDVFAKLHAENIMANLHYIPVYLQPYYANLGFVRGYCPNAEHYYRRAISIPMYPTLTDEQQKYVVDVIKEVLL
jgi:dTDP-4-amino-4,6-dideoxygalactose transaminase